MTLALFELIGGGLFAGFLLLMLGLSILWVWMLIEVLTKEPDEGNDKVVWLIVIIMLPTLGSLIYFFVRRPQRITQTGQ